MNKRDIRCYTKADSHRCWKEKRVNFQEVHSYYQTLKIDTYLAEIIEEGEALSVGINKKIELNPGYIYFLHGWIDRDVHARERINCR